MSERLRESVSAMMDGEVEDLELRRLLSESDQGSVRESWQSYHRVQMALKGDGAEFVHWDISGRVRAAIEDEEGVTQASRSRGWLQPLAGFAVAASVALVVVFTATDVNTLNPGASTSQGDMLSRVFPTTGGLAVSAGNDIRSVAPATSPESLPGANARADEEARKRLEQYMMRHTENAALNNGQGMISFARAASFELE